MSKKNRGEYGDSGNYLAASFNIEKYTKDKRAIADALCSQIFDKTQSMFEWRGLPCTIPARWLEMTLQRTGYAVIVKVENPKSGLPGLYALYGGLGGRYNAYYQPTIATLSSPWLEYEKTVTIEGDKEGILVSSDTLRRGLLPVVGKYVGLLTENCISLRIADIMTRATAILSASDSDTEASAREFLRQIEEGTLGVVKDSTFLDNDFQVTGTQTQAHNQITDLIELEQYLKASLWNELGLLANYNMKRESLTAAETELNDDTTRPLVDDMLKCRQDAAERINAKFGTNISVSFSGAWAKDREESPDGDQTDSDVSELVEPEDGSPEKESDDIKRDDTGNDGNAEDDD